MTGVDDARAPRRPLVIEAEPAFRTAHANPYNARLATTIAADGHTVRDLSYVRLFTRPIDIVHLHWPELTFLTGRPWRAVARMALFRAGMRVARLRNGTKVVWTVHNVASHERRSTPRLRAMHRRLLTQEVDGLLSLSAGGLEAARDAYPELADRPGTVTPHGHYRLDYDVTLPREQARAERGVGSGAPVVASVGMIRRYKNIPELVRTVVAGDADVELVIAGKPAGAELADEIRTAAADDPRVRLDLAFQSDAAIMAWIRAADVVVLPYRAIQNSGSAILALSADRPVVVPALGAMRELQEQVGADWVRCYEGEFDADELARTLEWAARPRADRAPLDRLDWGPIAQRTVEAYRWVRDPGAEPRPVPETSVSETSMPATSVPETSMPATSVPVEH
ncbi:glycosyltransferase family 4 protein [Agromyces sp. NPDC058110]|uniref:glycosyltransferase family 4 protein n=1 Tax=Agromyces sp. NPDC058110 TaxID=3346345 RepID=UPI0036DC9EEB